MPRVSNVEAEQRLFTHEVGRGNLDPGDSKRHEIALLAPRGSIGCEIGVDTGQLSERFLQLDHFSSLHSVDKWDDHAHSEKQYWAVTQKLMQYPKSRVWRMTAQQFARLTPDNMFGFIYIDCYAHTGQDGGEVLAALWPKLKDGGVFSGDDYDSKAWPLTVKAVDKFAASVNADINISSEFITDARVPMDGHPSWWFFK